MSFFDCWLCKSKHKKTVLVTKPDKIQLQRMEIRNLQQPPLLVALKLRAKKTLFYRRTTLMRRPWRKPWPGRRAATKLQTSMTKTKMTKTMMKVTMKVGLYQQSKQEATDF